MQDAHTHRVLRPLTVSAANFAPSGTVLTEAGRNLPINTKSLKP